MGCKQYIYFLISEKLEIADCFKNLLCKRIHVKFCKYILGVHRKSTNFALLSELRRLEALHHDINCQIVKSWNMYRFENLSI